jgi:hypothetical protein
MMNWDFAAQTTFQPYRGEFSDRGMQAGSKGTLEGQLATTRSVSQDDLDVFIGM